MPQREAARNEKRLAIEARLGDHARFRSSFMPAQASARTLDPQWLNDGIDQLNMFNKSLSQFCADGRQIDGLVLTKFDTIDDKVGATLSMTYKTGQPIMFIGVGQKYTHLKKLSVNAVINSLFK